MARIVPNPSAFRKRNRFAGDSFKFKKRSEYFFGAHHETLSVVAVCINNPHCLPFEICRRESVFGTRDATPFFVRIAMLLSLLT